MRTRILGGLVAALTALVIASCSGATPPPAGTGHDPADVVFVTNMIPHHRGALEMAQLAPARAASPEVRALATRIAGEQAPEIDRMTAMLSAWGAPPAGETGGAAGMPGMDTAGLATLSGPAFDREFLTMMTAHHAGAVTMGQTELAQGRDPQARDLASSIIAAQQAEIAEMQGLLGRV